MTGVQTCALPILANSSLFVKNGFREVANDGAGNELLVFTLKEGLLPAIRDWKMQLATYQGLHIVYSKQCPWVARMVEEIKESDLAKKLVMQITELKTPADAQNAPSLYSVFNLINNGKLLADRYISITRFNNILKKEKLI